MGHKRPREPPAEATHRTEIYEDLAHVDEKIRLKAAHTLLTEVVPKADVDQQKEILRRLIRGLCSGRKAARLGFSVALTEFLGTLFRPDAPATTRFRDISSVISTLILQTHAANGVDGQENRDHQIGRLFGAEAIIKSGILFQASVDNRIFDRILDVIYEIAKKKPWLREQCGFVLSQSLENSPTAEYAQAVIDKLQSAELAKTPEGVAIWIGIQKHFPTVSLPSEVWQGNSPLNCKEKSVLAMILKEASASNLDDTNPNANASQRGSWSANVHFAWLVVINKILSLIDKEKKTNKCLAFGDFWKECIEDGLFKNNSSDERKYWGLVIFQQSLSMAVTSEVVSILFSFKLMQCLTNHLAFSERYLHRAAQKARKTIIDRAQSSSDMKIMILKALLMNGFVDFDKSSKTRTIDELLSGLTESETPQICEIYIVLILLPGLDEEKAAAQRRQIAADQLVSAIKSLQIGSGKATLENDSSERNIQTILTLFARFAYFGLGSSAQPEISTGSRDLFKARISTCFTFLAANAKNPFKFSYHLTRVMSERKDIPEDAKLLLEVEPAIQDVLDQTINTIRQIVKELERSTMANDGFFKSALSLMSLTYIQVHDGDLDAISMLVELNETYSKRHLKQYAKQGLKSSAAVVEILLTLVAKPSKLFRRLSLQVFDSISQDIDEKGLQSMLKVLEAKEDLEGQDALFEQDASNEEVDEEDIDSDASNFENSDVKISSSYGQESDTADDPTSSSADDEEEEEEEEEDDEDSQDEELAAFNAKLAQALGVRHGNEDSNAEDDNDNSSDDDMNDAEMEALDVHLSTFFQERRKATSQKPSDDKNKSKQKKEAKKQITDFKSRVLDLLEIFIKNQPQTPITLTLIPPFLTLLRTTSSPQVCQKVSHLLREYARLCKGKGKGKGKKREEEDQLPRLENPEWIFDMLEGVHQEALRTPTTTGGGSKTAHGTACSQASLLLVRILASTTSVNPNTTTSNSSPKPENLQRIIAIYAATYATSLKKTLFEKGFKAQTSLFMDFNNWASSFQK